MATHPLQRSDLRTLIRQRADLENSTFVTDAELNDFINESIRDWWEFLTAIHGDNFLHEVGDVTTVAGQRTYNLPDEAHKVIRVAVVLNGFEIPISPLSYADAILDETARSWTNTEVIEYHLAMGGYDGTSSGGIRFNPIPSAVHTVRIYYHPRPPELVNDTDTLILGFDEWIILDCAIKCRVKEETDPSALIALKERYEQRTRDNGSVRDVGKPHPIADVRSVDSTITAHWWWRA